MRYAVVGFCVVTAACAGTSPSAPTAPSSTILGAAVMEARGGSELPFRGTLQAKEKVAPDGHCLTPVGLHCLNGAGEATHLGRFTLTSEFTVTPPPASTASGTATWTAANGDEIFTSTAGQAVITFPVAAIAETHTIIGGTGRFVDASGSLVVNRSLNLPTLVSSASLTGTISLGH
jgi:hypothetical protein